MRPAIRVAFVCLCLAAGAADAQQFVDSPYLEPFPDDPCDTQITPSLATTGTTLLQQMLNDPARRVFCVAPGDYRAAGRIDLLVSGAPGLPRIMRFDAENDVANAVQRGPQAIFERIVLLGSYWAFHGLTFRPRLAASTWFMTIWGSDHVLFDGNLLDGAEQPNAGAQLGIMVAGYQGDAATYNTVQRNVVRNGNATYADADYVGIEISEGKAVGERNDFNKVLDNEVYDWGDAVAVSGHKEDCTEIEIQHGTIIDGNDLYITAAKHNDCATGAVDPNGHCSCAENGVDTKSDPGADPDLYTRITNNRIWGMRPTSPNGHCGGSGANGQAITAGSFCPGHTLVSRNVVTDATIGLTIAGPSWIVTGNLFNEIRQSDNGPYGTRAIQPAAQSTDLEIQFNTVVGTDASYDDLSSYTDTRCNAILEDRALSGATYARGIGHSTMYNYLYQSPQPNIAGPTNVSLGEPTDSGNTPYCFWRKRWTGPERVCIPFGATQPTSQHMAVVQDCNADLTVQFGLGQTSFPTPEPGAMALAATGAAVLAALARRRAR
jgi:hypothetical protein